MRRPAADYLEEAKEGFAIDSFPFTFDLDLDSDLHIVEMHDLSVNTNP